MDEEMTENIAKEETLSVQKDRKDLGEIAIETGTETVIVIETAIAVGETTTRAAIGVARGAAQEIVRETETGRETETAIARETAIVQESATGTEALEEVTEDLARDRGIEIDTVDDDYSLKLPVESVFNSQHMLTPCLQTKCFRFGSMDNDQLEQGNGDTKELASKMVLIQNKRFYLDVKKNDRGMYVPLFSPYWIITRHFQVCESSGSVPRG